MIEFEDDDASDDAEAAEFVSQIEDMLASGDFEWAVDTLCGIMDTVGHRGQVTEGQRRAVRNIADARKWEL